MSGYIRKGYNVLVVDLDRPKASLVCPECDLIIRNAVQTQDGIRLCEPCFKAIADVPDLISPKTRIDVSGTDGKPFSFPDKAVRREVQQLKVKCKNVSFGCSWIGSLVDCFETHQNQCEYQPLECPMDGCDEAFPHDMLRNHLDKECLYRDICCKYCNAETKPIHLKEHHDSCESKPIQCRHCEKMVPRREIEHHNTHDCNTLREGSPVAEDSVELQQLLLNIQNTDRSPKAIIETPFSFPDKAANREAQQLKVECKNVRFGCSWVGSLVDHFETHQHQCEYQPMVCPRDGCNEVFPRDMLKKHLDEECLYRIIRCENCNAETKPIHLKIHHQNECNQDESLGDGDEVFEVESNSNPMYEPPLELLASSSTTNMDLNGDSCGTGHVVGISPQLESQTPTVQTQEQQRPMSVLSATTSESFRNVDQSRVGQLEKRYEDMELLVSLLKVHVSELELQLQASLASTHNGSFLWRIPDVKRRKRNAIEERITSLYSPPFYTGRNGYKMCIRSYLNGDGIGYQTHLSLFFVVMKGEFDVLLKWPFDYKVSLILVDQNHRKHIVQTFKPTPESSSFQRPVSDMNVASGCPKFADLSVLEENADNTHVKDDVMFVKCIIDTSRIFHP